MSSWLNVSIVVHSINPPRFGLRHPYSQALISIYKSIPESAFEPTSKVWHFPFHAKSDVLKKVRALPGVDVEELPSFVQSLVNVVREEVTGVGGVSGPKDVEEEIQYRMGSVPEKLMSSLYPFQVESLVLAVKRRGRILLGDEMGLGKTLQALAIACAYREDWPILVVAPSSLRANWRDEAAKWVPGLTKENIQIVKDAKAGVRDGALMVVVSYDLATRMADKSLLWKGQFEFVIADESHYLKSVDAQRTRAIVPLIQRSARALCLSGTPALSRPAELFMQLNALMPRAFGSFLPFAQRYCAAHQASWGLDTRGSSNTSELKMIMEEAVMIRRLKDQVLSELLPGKDRQIVDVPCDPKIMKEIAEVKKEKKNIEKDLEAVTEEWQKARLNGELRAATSQLYSASGLAKVNGVLGHLKMLLDEDGGSSDEGMPTPAKGNAPASDGASSVGDASEAFSGHEGLQGVGRLEESSSIEGGSRNQVWACSRCTFLNPATTLKCQMCASPKPREERTRESVEREGRSERARLAKKVARKSGKEESEGVPAAEVGSGRGQNERKDDVGLGENGRRTRSQLTSCSGKKTLSDGEDGDEWMENSDDDSNNKVMGQRLAGGGRRLTKLGEGDGSGTFSDNDSSDEDPFGNDYTPRQSEKKDKDGSGSDQGESDLKGDLVTCKGERGGISDRASCSSEDVGSIKPVGTSEVAIGSKETKAGVKSSSNDRNESLLSDEDDDVVCVHPSSRGNGIFGKDPVHRAAAVTTAKSRTKKGKKEGNGRGCSRGRYDGFNTDECVENGEADRADEDDDDDIFHSDLMFAKDKMKQRQLWSRKQERGSIVGKSGRKRSKLVVFAHHKAVMNLLESGLNDIGVRSVRIDGTTSQAERQPIVNRFQQDESLSVILLAITAAGVGITLTAASCAIFAELYWTPGSMAQAEDRIHRIGQKAKTVLIQYMVGRGTVDDVMIPLIHRKQCTLKSTVGLNQDTGDYSKVSGTKRESSGSSPKAKHQQITSKPRANVSTTDRSQRKLEFAPSLARKPNPVVGMTASAALDIKGGTIPTRGAASPAALTEARVEDRSASKPLSQGTLSDFVDVSQPEDLPRHRPGFPATITPTVRGGYTPPRQFRNLNGGPVVVKSSSGEHIVTHPPSSRSALDFALKETSRDRPPAGPTVGREKGTKQAVVLTAEQQERIARNKRAALQKLAERKRQRQMQQAQPGWLRQEQGKTNSSHPQSPSFVVLTPPVSDSPSARIAPRWVASPTVRADTPPGRVGGGVEGVGSGERPQWRIGVTGSRGDESSCIKGEPGRNSSGERETAAVETGRLKRTSD